MKLHSLLTSLLAILLTFSLSAAPKPKQKILQLSDFVIYQGDVIKKLPEGVGELTVYDSRDIKNTDVITGVFSNNRVTNATLTFAGGLKYRGDLTFTVGESGVDYELQGGDIFIACYHSNSLSGYTMYYRPVVCVDEEAFAVDPLQFNIDSSSPVKVTRQYEYFNVKHPVIATVLETKVLSPGAKKFVEDFAPFVKEAPKASYNVRLTLARTNISVNPQVYKYSLNLGEGRIVTCSGTNDKCRYQLDDKSGKIDVTYESVNLLPFYNSAKIVERVFDNGTLTVSSSLDSNWENYLSSENLALLRSINHIIESDNSMYVTSHCLQVKYNDGRVYNGNLYTTELPTSSSMQMPNAVSAVVKYETLPDASYFACGALSYPDGKQDAFLNGVLLTECLEYSKKRDEDRNKAADEIRQRNLRRVSFERGLPFVLKGNIESVSVVQMFAGGYYMTLNNLGQIQEFSVGAGTYMAETTYKYDSKGRVEYSIEKQEDEAEGTCEIYKEYYYYDDNDNVIRTEKYKYGDLVSYSLYVYDSRANCVKSEHFIGKRRSAYIDYYYDSKGNLVKEVMNGSNVITYLYNSSGRLIRKIRKEGSNMYTHEFKYDSVGNVVEETVYENSSREPHYQDVYEYVYRD